MKRKLKIIVLIVILLINMFCVHAQTRPGKEYDIEAQRKAKSWMKDMIRQLRIGDTLPSVILSNVEHWNSSILKMSDFKGKLIILDFWGIFCSACIEHLPDVQELQNKFGDKLQFIAVTRDQQKYVAWREAQNPVVFKNLKIPMYNDDQILYKYFYYNGVPFYVWIDDNGVVRGIGDDPTESKVTDFLSGTYRQTNPSMLKKFNDFDMSKPAILEGNGRNYDKVSYYSVILNPIDGFGNNGNAARQNFYDYFITKTDTILFLDNQPLFFLLRDILAAENPAPSPYSFLLYTFNRWDISELKDSSLLYKSFCYELKVPEAQRVQASTIMRTDLERYFKVTARIESRKENVVVIKRDTTSLDKKQSASNFSNYIQEYKKAGRNISDKELNSGFIGGSKEKKVFFFINTTIDQVLRSFPIPIRKGSPIYINDGINSADRFTFTVRARENPKTGELELNKDLFIEDLNNAGFNASEQIQNIPMVVFRDLNEDGRN